ncbi:MAG: site-specific integrase [Methanobrevibacter sp.]|nr:site-specific integrase [Methanobrevibacter sp.]
MSMSDLIEEAELEEEQGIRWKKRKLKRRLLTFRQYMIENYALNTVKTTLTPIISIYKYYEIEILDLPRMNTKGIRTPEPITFKDLPDKTIIRKALSVANPRMSAIIYFMASTGCARRETLNLTVQDYITALGDYTDKTDIFEVIDEIKGRDDIVPTFSVLRQKTNKYYTTYCSPEAVAAINSYLLSRTDPLTIKSPLFKIHEDYFTQAFERINEELGLGKVGNYNRFRSHMLRKFHASALYNDGMSLDNVNDLQGKAKNKTDASYFMTNPEDLKYEYIKHLHAITINKDVEKLSIKSPEFIQLENQKNRLESEISSIRAEMGDVKDMKKKFEDFLASVGK